MRNPFSVNAAQKAQPAAELLLFPLQINEVTPRPRAAVQTIRPSKLNATVKQFDQEGDGDVIVRDNDDKMVIISKYRTLK